MSYNFEEVITTRDRLREITGGEPSSTAANKVIDHIDEACRSFISLSPFIMVATKGGDGLLDLSPKGDTPGFVTVLDNKTLAIPDRSGNRRHDSFENLFINPEIGLFFMIPGKGQTLRMSGTGLVVRDGALQARLASQGEEPQFILIVTIEEAFMHCSKCMMRSHLWQHDEWS